MLVLGICLGVSASPDFDMLGFIICTSSVVGSTLQIVLTGLFTGNAKGSFHVFDILLYTALPCLAFLAPMAYLMGDHYHFSGAVDEIGLPAVLGLCFAGGFMAFSYNIITICLIKYTSSVYYAVAGGFKVCIVIGVSFLFFDQSVTLLSFIGIIISCLAFVGNSYLTFREKSAKKKPIKVVDDSDAEVNKGLISGQPKTV